MKQALRILTGFVHDFATGLWTATVVAVWWLHREALAQPPLAESLQALMRRFFWWGVVFAVAVFATGAGRTFTYVDGVYGPEAEASRRRLLIGKHVVLLAVFGAGMWWQWQMAYK